MLKETAEMQAFFSARAETIDKEGHTAGLSLFAARELKEAVLSTENTKVLGPDSILSEVWHKLDLPLSVFTPCFVAEVMKHLC